MKLARLTTAALLTSVYLRAQDTRHVTEPHVPPACAVLTARLAAENGVLPEAGERTPDTERIQNAIDGCEKGKAVALRAAGGKNIFLSGPIELKAGVTLLVEAGTALFASRNPRDYDMAPGSCGVAPARRAGCKPLIAASHAPDSGIMGDGAIDGRGGAKLLGEDTTWWASASRATAAAAAWCGPSPMKTCACATSPTRSC
ncbi:MAG: hypothetical protein ABSB88_12565 [Bryobacteraceae bacterium]